MLETISRLKSRINSKLELIIVNDGSTSNVTEEGVQMILDSSVIKTSIHKMEVNKGKGAALRRGVMECSSNYIIFTDIDFPYIEENMVMLSNELLKDSNDVVLGHRNYNYYEKTPFLRKIISKMLRRSLKFFLRLPTDDSQCGLKGFNEKGARIFAQTTIDRFLFDLEFIKKASKSKLKITTISVELRPNVVFSKVGLKILFKEFGNFLKILIKS
ncbi:MAG: glycosyltransferase [Crocinitomicaceae bacterium]|nr:glycosyltransferase [Crocinitomicaceae bacterium]